MIVTVLSRTGAIICTGFFLSSFSLFLIYFYIFLDRSEASNLATLMLWTVDVTRTEFETFFF